MIRRGLTTFLLRVPKEESIWESRPLTTAWSQLRNSKGLHISSISCGGKDDGDNNGRKKNHPEDFLLDPLDEDGKEQMKEIKQKLEQNTYFDKYKEKIVMAQRTAPYKFMADMTEKLGIKPHGKFGQARLKSPRTNLDKILNVSLLNELDREEITRIWKSYHLDSALISDTMHPTAFEAMRTRAIKNNTFVLPLPRNSGHEFHVVQFEKTAFYFTPLISYQNYADNSPVNLSLTCYDDLVESKSLVLMRGEFDKNSMSLKEAQFMCVQLQMYYTCPNEKRMTLLERFLNSPKDFSHMDLIQELESMVTKYQDVFPDLEHRAAS